MTNKNALTKDNSAFVFIQHHTAGEFPVDYIKRAERLHIKTFDFIQQQTGYDHFININIQ